MSFQISGLGPLRQPRVLDTTYDPVGLWVFDGSLIDRGSGNDALSVDNGTLLYTPSHEHGRSAAYFNDNQVRLMGNIPAPDPALITGDVTVQVVFMMDTTVGIDTFGTALFYGAATPGGTAGEANNDLYQLMLDNATGQMIPRMTWEYGVGGRESVIATASTLTIGQWYHLVGVRETEGGGLCTGRLYLNGQLIKEETGLNEATGGNGGSNRTWIGRDPNNAGLGWLGGMISSAKVNDLALSAREVRYEYLRVSGEYLGDRL